MNPPKRAGGKIRKLEMANRVCALKAEDHTFVAIGEILAKEDGREKPYSRSYIRNLAYEGMEELRERRADYCRDVVQNQLDRLNAIWEAYEEQAMEGDTKAAGVCLSVVDRIADIKGLKRSVNLNLDLSPDKWTRAELEQKARALGYDTGSGNMKESETVPLTGPDPGISCSVDTLQNGALDG